MHPLKKARLSRGLSLAQLAKEAGCSSETIHAAEHGRIVSELTAFKLAIALDEDPEKFVRLLRDEPIAAATADPQPAA
jgi:transcriptional regulator with XRE-family HTH domain